MDKKQIENRDQELVSKFRTVVNGKQEGKKRKQARLKWLSAGVLVCCAILAFVLLRPSNAPNRASLTSTVKTVDQGPADTADTKAEPPVVIAKNKIAQPETKTAESPTESPMVVPETPLPKKAEAPETKPPVVIAKAVPEKQIAKTLPATRKQTVKGIRIARVVTCTGVSKLNFVSPTGVFSMEKDKKPVVWMEVYSEKQKLPYTLNHVYFVNGRKYCTVPLKIKYPRMRTWSRITLRYKYQVGKWRVDVVDGKGTILESKKFTVVP